MTIIRKNECHICGDFPCYGGWDDRYPDHTKWICLKCMSDNGEKTMKTEKEIREELNERIIKSSPIKIDTIRVSHNTGWVDEYKLYIQKIIKYSDNKNIEKIEYIYSMNATHKIIIRNIESISNKKFNEIGIPDLVIKNFKQQVDKRKKE